MVCLYKLQVHNDDQYNTTTSGLPYNVSTLSISSPTVVDVQDDNCEDMVSNHVPDDAVSCENVVVNSEYASGDSTKYTYAVEGETAAPNYERDISYVCEPSSLQFVPLMCVCPMTIR